MSGQLPLADLRVVDLSTWIAGGYCTKLLTDAGADVLYAPGLRTVEEIGAVCSALERPVNVLARPDLSAAEIFAAGAQRISVGGSLAWTALQAFVRVAEEIRDRGVFTGLGSSAGLEQWLAARPL